jgi:hypothetical protein
MIEKMLVDNPTSLDAHTVAELTAEAASDQQMINIPASLPEASPSHMQFFYKERNVSLLQKSLFLKEFFQKLL